MELEYKDNSRRGKVIIVLGVILALVAGASAFMLVTNAGDHAIMRPLAPALRTDVRLVRSVTALNGGPVFTITEAISFHVSCETQDEVDYLWKALTDGGEESQCGWLKDKYGLSWQIIPDALGQLRGRKRLLQQRHRAPEIAMHGRGVVGESGHVEHPRARPHPDQFLGQFLVDMDDTDAPVSTPRRKRTTPGIPMRRVLRGTALRRLEEEDRIAGRRGLAATCGPGYTDLVR